MQALPKLDPSQTALFLDFDGTLAELAPQHDAVEVPADLVALLQGLAERLDGALAIVSGRRLSELDALLAPLQLPVAAEHGADQRQPDGRRVSLPPPDLRSVIALARSMAQQHAGLRVEVKTAAVALHYRQAPALEGYCLQALTQALMRRPGLELLPGKYVLEVKASGFDKGSAMAAFMTEPAFAGRLPLFAGDDRTDEAGFAWVQSVGGHGLKVGEGATQARHRCTSPTELRGWLARTLAGMRA